VLEPYDPEQVTALHVVEKGGGVPDKTPVEQSEELAADSYAAVRTVFPDADDHTAYDRDRRRDIRRRRRGRRERDRLSLSRRQPPDAVPLR